MMPPYLYWLTEVTAGDWAGIFYARVDGVDICDNICTKRRPDGLVPPLPKEAEDLMDLRKQGQIPDIANRRYVPDHERANAFRARQAPMPREKGAGAKTSMQ